MSENAFADQGFKPGDVLVCCGVRIGAPKGIIGKAVKLDSSFMFWDPCLIIDNNDCHYYIGTTTKWRKPRPGDGPRAVITLCADFDTGELSARETGQTLADITQPA